VSAFSVQMQARALKVGRRKLNNALKSAWCSA